jgi:hypothetical protein
MTEYSVTNWVENGMTSGQILTALDNLECIYDDAIIYIDAILHGERYYTKTECGTKFFSASNDGTGSGLICETLGGLTAQQIMDAGIPSGCIAYWSGSEAGIPAGWYLCNGANGTPDLRDKFVIAAGGSYAKGATGGSNTVTPSASAVTVGGHVLTIDEVPPHTHPYTEYYTGSSNGSQATGPVNPSSHASTTTLVGSSSHGHVGSTFTGASTSVLPPFYALCIIMKS